MLINFILCEDKQVILNSIRTSLEKAIEQNGINAVISLATDNPRRIIEYSRQYAQGVNAYFLDINLEQSMNGLELAKQIRNYDPHCYITFITGHPELCMTVFRYHIEAFEYLVKPVTYQALEECVIAIGKHYYRYLNHQKHNKETMVIIRSGNRDYNVELHSIIYVESINQKLVVHTRDRSIEFFGYLKNIINDLNENGENFYRCHRSYIININHVKEVNYKDSYIVMSSGEKCYMSRQQKGEIRILLDRMAQKDDCII
ncbi:MAG TPA: LytTR family DNA-binding domain-containing protein [Bacillota bacterium]|nr:LytTR family DNA-binding domain-containing protein [Bacillota bacterium]HPL53566.1 LytTR family DNA-binding domain-containing protein [Bacillota bacterium]